MMVSTMVGLVGLLWLCCVVLCCVGMGCVGIKDR